MESTATLVVKVCYGDVIRRVRVSFKPNGQFDLDMANLKAMIASLFYLPLDAECFLTYSDEDGDVVALFDDNDLLDVSYQNLKFLKINVQLKSAMPTNPITPESNGILMPPNSQNLEPNRTISKVSMDLASKPEASGYNPDDISKLPKLVIPKPRSFVSPVISPCSSASWFSEVLDLAGEKKKDVSERTQTGPEPADLNEVFGFVDSKTSSGLVPTSSGPFSGSPVNDSERTQTGQEPANVNEVSGFTDSNTSGHVPTSSGPISSSTVNNPCPNSVDLKKHDRSVGPSKKRTAVHKYIECDGCGALPITGPRFHSKVEEDYDLCNLCFTEMGNEWDYTRMDMPVQKLHDQFTPLSDPPLPQPKLESLFVFDVDTPEGTALAPSTKFTKSWRMMNNGSFVWPRGTKMVWDGGDCLNDISSVDLQIPEEGVGINSEFDVKVDFVAPKLPGGYLSYWRMASPLGALFGQRVFVLIHVDASLENSESVQPESYNVNPATAECAEVEREFKKSQVGEKEVRLFGKVIRHPLSSSPFDMGEFSNRPRHMVLCVDDGSSTKDIHVPLSKEVKHKADKVDMLEEFSSMPVFEDLSGGGSSTKDISKDEEHNDVEITMLKELEEMGFKEIDFNKKILRENEYNLEKSVDTLCEFSEWDWISDELYEARIGGC